MKERLRLANPVSELLRLHGVSAGDPAGKGSARASTGLRPATARNCSRASGRDPRHPRPAGAGLRGIEVGRGGEGGGAGQAAPDRPERLPAPGHRTFLPGLPKPPAAGQAWQVWRWLRNQPNGALSKWCRGLVSARDGRARKRGIMALARKLLMACGKCGQIPSESQHPFWMPRGDVVPIRDGGWLAAEAAFSSAREGPNRQGTPCKPCPIEARSFRRFRRFLQERVRRLLERALHLRSGCGRSGPDHPEGGSCRS